MKGSTKSVSRLVSIHPVGSAEYKRDFDKLLPDGKTCLNCIYSNKCQSLFQEHNTECQFTPNRFTEKRQVKIRKKIKTK